MRWYPGLLPSLPHLVASSPACLSLILLFVLLSGSMTFSTCIFSFQTKALWIVPPHSLLSTWPCLMCCSCLLPTFHLCTALHGSYGTIFLSASLFYSPNASSQAISYLFCSCTLAAQQHLVLRHSACRARAAGSNSQHIIKLRL